MLTYIMFLLNLNVIIYIQKLFLKGDIMKKLLVFTLLFITSITLVACDTTPDRVPVDCDLYPTHVDCLEDDPIIDDPIVDPADFDPADIGFLDIYYLNDFHGSILENSPDEMGFANIGNFLITQKEFYIVF